MRTHRTFMSAVTVGRSFNHPHRRANQSGVTFIELLVAIVILLVGMMAALGYMTTATLASRNAQKLVIAKDLAADTLEQIFTMRDLNAIGGLPPSVDRNRTTFDKLANTNGIFPNTFQTIKLDNGPDLIRGTTDDLPAVDTRYTGYLIRILIRSAAVASNPVDPINDPEPSSTDNVKRIIIEVQYPLFLVKSPTAKLQKARLETIVTVPPSQTRVS